MLARRHSRIRAGQEASSPVWSRVLREDLSVGRGRCTDTSTLVATPSQVKGTLTVHCKAVGLQAQRDCYRTAARARRAALAVWAGHEAPLGPRILRKDLRVKSLPLPVIVHAAPTASRAATPSLRDACGTLDPPDTTRRAASTREPEGSRHPGRADWPVPRGGVKAGLTVDRRRPDRPPVCRIRAKVPDAAIMGAAYAAGQRHDHDGGVAPLKRVRVWVRVPPGAPAETVLSRLPILTRVIAGSGSSAGVSNVVQCGVELV